MHCIADIGIANTIIRNYWYWCCDTVANTFIGINIANTCF